MTLLSSLKDCNENRTKMIKIKVTEQIFAEVTELAVDTTLIKMTGTIFVNVFVPIAVLDQGAFTALVDKAEQRAGIVRNPHLPKTQTLLIDKHVHKTLKELTELNDIPLEIVANIMLIKGLVVMNMIVDEWDILARLYRDYEEA